MVERYPLHWPEGRARTRPEQRLEAELEATFAQATRRVMHEARLLRLQGPVVSLDVPLGPHGEPLEGHGDRQPDDTGAALYFVFEGTRHCISCDHWHRVEDNIQAIALTLESLKRLKRIGGPEIAYQALGGFIAKTAAEGELESWWNVLDVAFDAPLYAAEAAYRKLVLSAHPDRGGSAEAMIRLNMAIHEARLRRRSKANG
jgi:hypothetical protein